MRFLSILCLLAGLGLGILYPNYITYFSGAEIGTWTVFTRAGGFKPVTVPLKSTQAPVRVVVNLQATGNRLEPNATTNLTLTATVAGRTVMAEVMDFNAKVEDTKTPQNVGSTYTQSPGVIANVDDGDYLFVTGPGENDLVDMKEVKLSLRANSLAADPRYQPAGLVLLALGFVGLILSLTRGGKAETPQNPGRKWGRDGGEGEV